MRRRLTPILVLGLALVIVVILTPAADGIVLTGHFTDDNGHLFENDIDAIADVGITKGCNPPANTTYCPGNIVDRGAMAAFLRRALNLPSTTNDHFTDDNNSIFEGDINAIAEVGITKGCNPPANTRYCPNAPVERGAMAAFLRRALNFPLSNTDFFTDDNNSIFEADINAIAEADVTKGCNPPANTNFCPGNVVDRGAMAAFLRRALSLPSLVQQIPVGYHSAMVCSKDGERCSLTVDVSAGQSYLVEEGLFQVLPASPSETAAFNDSGTLFGLSLDGPTISINEVPVVTEGDLTERRWTRTVSFSSGNHTLIGIWSWSGDEIQRNTITVRASN